MPIFDSHTYLTSSSFFSSMRTRPQVLGVMDRFGLDAIALVSHLGVTCDYTSGNRNLREVCDAESGIFGYVTLNTEFQEDSIQEQRLYLGKSGVRCVAADRSSRPAGDSPASRETLSTPSGVTPNPWHSCRAIRKRSFRRGQLRRSLTRSSSCGSVWAATDGVLPSMWPRNASMSTWNCLPAWMPKKLRTRSLPFRQGACSLGAVCRLAIRPCIRAW